LVELGSSGRTKKIRMNKTQNQTCILHLPCCYFDDVVELGSHSKKIYIYIYLSIALQKLRHELLIMDNDCDKDIDDDDIRSAKGPVLNSQALLNNTFILQDPIHVLCRG
jgi:hypothetical protein